MRYMGGKQRIANRLAPIIQEQLSNGTTYIEPFVGSAAVLSKIKAETRIGSDVNAALIALWKALSAGWDPPEHLSEDEYIRIRTRMDDSDPLTAFAGFGCSFAGKWFGGYAREWDSNRNYAANAASSLRKKQKTLQSVTWICGDYRECPTPGRSVIYCDPPYQNTTKFGGAGFFDHGAFWNWCRMKSRSGHTLLISEYTAPEDFELLAEFQTKLDLRAAKAGKEPRVERLFSPKRAAR